MAAAAGRSSETKNGAARLLKKLYTNIKRAHLDERMCVKLFSANLP